jgi:hypothetical protein
MTWEEYHGFSQSSMVQLNTKERIMKRLAESNLKTIEDPNARHRLSKKNKKKLKASDEFREHVKKLGARTRANAILKAYAEKALDFLNK